MSYYVTQNDECHAGPFESEAEAKDFIEGEEYERHNFGGDNHEDEDAPVYAVATQP